MAVKEAYVEPVDDKALMDSAIRGLLLDLDPHSAYLDKDDAEAFDEDTSGAYDGIGVEVQDRKSVVEGKMGSVRVAHGGGRRMQTKTSIVNLIIITELKIQ